jgi:hypothetical protein
VSAPPPTTRLHVRDGIEWLEFEALRAGGGVRHGVFGRGGGVSPAPFDSLNVGVNCGDGSDNVRVNRERIQRCLGLPHAAYLRQVHGGEVRVHARADRNAERRRHQALLDPQAGDALVSDIPGLLLVIQVADCQAVLLHDPRRRVVANIHAGWRGSVAEIVPRTVAVMERRFGCLPGDLLAAVCPSLGPCCAEFIRYRDEIPERYWAYGNAARHFDFWAITRDQLRRSGVPSDRIAISGVCTRCHPERYFSYRGQRTTGRFAAAIGLTA